MCSRSAVALILAAQLACLPEVKERCRLVTEARAAPALPADLAQLDGLLLRRANEMTLAARELKRFVVWDFRVTFAGTTLPILCGKLERARELAMAGRTAEAGRRYQALLVASQVLQMDVAMHAAAQYADIGGQPQGQIATTLETFEHQVRPTLEAALSEEPGRIKRALAEHPEAFRIWVEYLTRWPVRVEDGAEQARTAKLVWDIAFLVVATHQAAVAAAEVAAAGGPPMTLLPAFVSGGGATAARLGPVASVELTEAIRRLIAAGVLDAGVVVALSKTLGTQAASSARPIVPNTSQMSSGEDGPGVSMAGNSQVRDELTIRPDVTLSGGRSGERVKELVGPPRSAVRGSGERAFFTNDKGQVILDVTRERAKPVMPGVGFGPKRVPTPHELEILDQVLGGTK